VISNLRHQLAQLRMSHRLPEVLDESVRVRADLGYPIMVTPFSQFVVSQAAINVFLGERYREVTDEVIRYALGHYGREAGCAVDPGVRDRITERPRGLELARQEPEEASLEEVRRALGGSGLSDEELLLRYMVGSERDIARMRRAGPPRPHPGPGVALMDLIRGLAARPDVRRVAIQKPDFSLVLEGVAPEGSTAGTVAVRPGG
jgi:oxaloacetate decarboxylase alpha subunit